VCGGWLWAAAWLLLQSNDGSVRWGCNGVVDLALTTNVSALPLVYACIAMVQLSGCSNVQNPPS
jgi:hypothetical protein